MSLDRNKIAYSLDDVLLVPKKNHVKSRLDTNTAVRLSSNYGIQIPIMATNMSTVTEDEMMITMGKLGGIGVLHRFMDISRGSGIVSKVKAAGTYPIAASIGTGETAIRRALALTNAGANILMMDIAHGHSQQVIDDLKYIKEYIKADVIVGNVATYQGTWDLCVAGADGIRVGIGGGSRCTTRQVTGHGVPNLTALVESVRARNEYLEETTRYVPIIIDGGLKNSGDLVKALYFGADVGCFGGMFAGTAETPGEVITEAGQKHKKFYGMASKEAQDTHRGGMKNGTTAEGFSELVPYRGSVVDIVEQLVGGVRSGLTYSGVKDVHSLRTFGDYVILTQASQLESKLK